MEGHLFVITSGGEGHRDFGPDDHAAGLGVGVHLPALDNQVARQQTGNDDPVELPTQGTVVALLPGGLLGQDLVIGDRAHQLAVRDGVPAVLSDQLLGLDGVLHMEGDLLHHG